MSKAKPIPQELLTFAEVAQALGITIKQVRRLAGGGEFGPVYTSAGDRRKLSVERPRVESFRRFYQTPATTKYCGTEAATEADRREDTPTGHMVIAQHLSAILAHPATPGPVREEILAVLGSIDTEADTDPRHLAFILAAHANKEALKGGAS